MNRSTLVALTLLVAAPQVAAQSKVKSTSLTFGVYTSDKATTMYRQFTPVIEFLQASMEERMKSPVEIELRIYKTYAEAFDAFVAGKVDFVRFGPASYVLAKEQNPGIDLLAIEGNEGTKRFSGMVVVRADSPVKKLSDLRGRKFAFGDPTSTIGRFLVQERLLDAGIRSADLSGFSYLGSHDKVFRAVEVGDFDAGALKETTFAKLNNKKQLRVLDQFDNVTKPWIARAGLAPEVTSALRDALIGLKDADCLATLGASGLMPTSDQDFAAVRVSMQKSRAFEGVTATPGK